MQLYHARPSESSKTAFSHPELDRDRTWAGGRFDPISGAARSTIPHSLEGGLAWPNGRAAQLLLDGQQTVMIHGSHLAGIQSHSKIADAIGISPAATRIHVVAALQSNLAGIQRLAHRAQVSATAMLPTSYKMYVLMSDGHWFRWSTTKSMTRSGTQRHTAVIKCYHPNLSTSRRATSTATPWVIQVPVDGLHVAGRPQRLANLGHPGTLIQLDVYAEIVEIWLA